jgi:hypothetical protein
MTELVNSPRNISYVRELEGHLEERKLRCSAGVHTFMVATFVHDDFHNTYTYVKLSRFNYILLSKAKHVLIRIQVSITIAFHTIYTSLHSRISPLAISSASSI